MAKYPKNKDFSKGKHLILIGFMGSGKTSLGLRLSYRLQMAAEDTDKLIEAKEGRTISEIFRTDGEAAFRRMETELLREIRERKGSPKIYSLGGGTPVQLENQPLIRQCGTVIYLRIRPETVYERLKSDTTRPLLQCEDPLGRIKDLIAKRGPAYERCADYIVDVDGCSQQDVLNKIEEYLQESGWNRDEK